MLQAQSALLPQTDATEQRGPVELDPGLLEHVAGGLPRNGAWLPRNGAWLPRNGAWLPRNGAWSAGANGTNGSAGS